LLRSNTPSECEETDIESRCYCVPCQCHQLGIAALIFAISVVYALEVLEEQVCPSETTLQANGVFFFEEGISTDSYETAARAEGMSTSNLFISGETSGSSGDHAAACMVGNGDTRKCKISTY